MKHLIISLTLLAATLGPARADNAALQYWQAFALMPALDDEARDHLKNWKSIDLDAGVQEAMVGIQPAFQLLVKARHAKSCDWGIDLSEGFSTHLPHLAKARELAMAALIDCRIHMASGRNGRALDQLLGAMALARRVGEGNILISVLVQASLEASCTQFLAHHWGDFSNAEINQLRSALGNMNAGGSVLKAIRAEQEMIMHSLSEKSTAAPAGNLELASQLLHPFGTNLEQVEGHDLHIIRNVLDQLNNEHFTQAAELLGLGASKAELQAALQQVGGKSTPSSMLEMAHAAGVPVDPAVLPLMVNEVKDLLHEIEFLFGLAPDKFDEAHAAFEKKVANASGLAQTVLPDPKGIYRTYQRQLLLRRILDAALAHRLDGTTTFEGLSTEITEEKLILGSTHNTDGLSFNLHPASKDLAQPDLGDAEDRIAEAAKQVALLANARNNGKYAAFREELKAAVAGALEGGADLQISDEEGQQLLDILMKHAITLATTWTEIFEAAEGGDASAKSAALMFASLNNPKAQLLRYAFTHGDAECRKVIGDQPVEYIVERVGAHVGWQ